jgi:hypothetical protein
MAITVTIQGHEQWCRRRRHFFRLLLHWKWARFCWTAARQGEPEKIVRRGEKCRPLGCMLLMVSEGSKDLDLRRESAYSIKQTRNWFTNSIQIRINSRAKYRNIVVSLNDCI